MQSVFKTARLLILLLAVLLFLFSCRRPDHGEWLRYQEYPMEAVGLLEYDGEPFIVSVAVPKAGDLVLTITDHERLSGVTYTLTDGKASLAYGSLSLPLDNEYTADGLFLCSRLFALSPDHFREARVVTENGVTFSTMTFRTEEGDITVLTQRGLSRPDRITADLNGHSLSFQFVNEP